MPRANRHYKLKYFCKSRVDEAISEMDKLRDRKWTESVVVGSEKFIEVTKKYLALKQKAGKKLRME